MRFSIFITISFLLLNCSDQKDKYYDYPIQTVDIRNVELTDSFWLPKIKLIQNTTIRYAFDKCREEGRMKNFLIAGGKLEGKTCGKMPFDDTDLYKIIEGASYSLISYPNSELDAYLDSVIAIIKTGQEKDGYLTTWFTIDRKTPPAWWVKPSETRWENEISSHELYNSGHLFEAAAAHYLATGKRNFLDIALKNADLLVDNFGPEKLKTVPGHQIVETGLIKLYQITHKTKYLELAKFYLDERGDSTGHKLYGAYNQDHLPVVQQFEAVGHAVRAVYMYAGMTDIAAIYRDKAYLNAVNKLWENVVYKKMYITGGIGSRHEGEAFGDNYELPNLTAYNETCASIGNVYWNHRLFLLTGDSKYYDIIERTLYNGLISGISLDGKNFFYPNPLESDGKYAFNQGALTRSPWFDCSCCPTNMIRFLPSVPGLIYSTENDSLFVNLYISNNSKIKMKDTEINISQKTDYPWNGNINININPERESKFTLKFRIPGWAQNEAVPGDLYSYEGNKTSNISLKINGRQVHANIINGYVLISKEWEKGDNLELTLPMSVRKVITNPIVKTNNNLVAFEYGPVIFCAEDADNNSRTDRIVIPDKMGMTVEDGKVKAEKVKILKGNTAAGKSNVTLIPYYTWSNRGTGKMKVWLPEM